MQHIELELTYLAKSLPIAIKNCPSKQVIDVYFPSSDSHPCLRIRHDSEHYEITKKLMATGTDSSHMIEHTITLTAEEYSELTAQGGKRVAKTRYYYNYQGRTAEIDVFDEALRGLVLIDFEFTDRQDQLQFAMPDFCLAEVTQAAFAAGGKLAGKRYQDIVPDLQSYGYQPLFLD